MFDVKLLAKICIRWTLEVVIHNAIIPGISAWKAVPSFQLIRDSKSSFSPAEMSFVLPCLDSDSSGDSLSSQTRNLYDVRGLVAGKLVRSGGGLILRSYSSGGPSLDVKACCLGFVSGVFPCKGRLQGSFVAAPSSRSDPPHQRLLHHPLPAATRVS